MISPKDLSVAAGALGRSPGYAATIVLTLGFTLGALVTMFDLNYQLLATPLPYPGQGRLYISQGNAYKAGESAFADETPYPALIETYKNHKDRFDQSALVKFDADVIRNRSDSPRVLTSYVTPEYLQMLAAPMALGRAFNPDEGLETNSPVAVISHATWHELFSADPDVLGKPLRFGEVDFRIIGVTAGDFAEPQLAGTGRLTQVWLPWDYNPVPTRARNAWSRTDANQHLIGRLKLGTSQVQTAQELTNTVNGRFKDETAAQPFFAEITIDFKLVPFRQAILGDSKSRALLLLAGAVVLLLIAAANITNLTLARAANQQKNMAIQAALGAQKKHLFQAVFAEILLLVTLAALLSLAVSFGGIELLKRLAQSHLPRVAELHLNWPSLGFAVLVALLLASLFALLVSRQIDYRALQSTLQSSGKGTGIQISARVRQVLILSQVALAGMLLAASLQVLQQSLRHIAQPLGFATDDIHYLSLNLGGKQSASAAERRSDLIAIREELRNHPKVVQASLTSNVPIHVGGDAQWESFLSADPDFKQQQQAATALADESYLDILGLEFVSGRNFEPGAAQTDAKVLIVNETLARKWRPDGQVLDQLLYWRNSPDRGKTPYRVVGVVRDLSLPGRAEASRAFIAQIRAEDPLLLLKLKPGQEMTKAELNELIARVNGQYKVSTLLGMRSAHRMLVAQDSLSAGVTAALVLLALSLAAIGIYGVLSYTVLTRRSELGIRMAIGARPLTVFMQILRDNLLPVLIGQAVALAVLVGLWRWAQTSSYTLQTSTTSWLLPIVLIVALTAATTLLSVWRVIRRPAINAIRNG